MRGLIFLVATLFLAIGCKESNIDERVEQPTLNVDVESLELSYREQKVEIAVESSEEIDVAEQVLWININGVDKGKVKLSILKNDTEKAREADVIITAGELSHTVHIIQLAKGEVFSLVLGHSSEILDSPKWGGDNVSGRVDWGDGTSEEYVEGVSHEYTADDKHTATFDMEGATSFEIERVGEIESVEITL
jgi:hypothetical protein